MRIVFFGTPDFAAYTLRSLVDHGREVVGVVTMPDKPQGRGHRLHPSAVKETALELLPETPLLQPERLRDEDFLRRLETLQGDLFIVVAFRMLPEVVWSMPPLGTINLHAALLPRYRGAAPIQRALMAGDTETGVTTFLLDREIDTGRILLRHPVPIAPDETGGTLHDKLMTIGADLVEETIDLIDHSDRPDLLGEEQPSSTEGLPTAPKINKEDRLIRFSAMTATQIDRIVRALAPYPRAIATFAGEEGEIEVKLSRVKPLEGSLSAVARPGEYRITDDRRLLIQATKGTVELLELQWPSGRIMPTDAFLLGHTPFPSGHFL